MIDNMKLKPSSKLSFKDIEKHLENKVADKYSFLLLDSIDSTNTLAKELAREEGRSSCVIISDHQSAGRGRLGRSFYSPRSDGLYMSVLIDPQKDDIDLGLLTQFAAVATAKAIEGLVGQSVGIKWVNDLLINEKKVCGILCESGINENGVSFAVVGIGINIRERDFPDDIKDIAGSLYSCTGILVERSVLAASIVENLDSYSPDFMDDYRARSVVLGKTVRVINSEGEYLARALSIENDGSLKVLCNDGTEKNLCFGEISLRLDKDGRV